MALAHDQSDADPFYMPLVKQLSGARVEAERRRRGISQVALGRRVGIGPTWIRQLEGGYTKVRLDDHLACLNLLDVSSLAVTLPMLFASQHRAIPPRLLSDDFSRLEPILVDRIIEWHLADMAEALNGISAK